MTQSNGIVLPVHLAALSMVGGVAATVRLLGHVLVVGGSAEVMPSRPRFVDSDDTGN